MHRKVWGLFEVVEFVPTTRRWYGQGKPERCGRGGRPPKSLCISFHYGRRQTGFTKTGGKSPPVFAFKEKTMSGQSAAFHCRARPTGCMRIRRTYCAAGGSCCRAVADAGPYRRGFILFVPSSSPSHRHMKALCRERRPRRSASDACHRGRFSLTTFSHGKRKTCLPSPSPPPPPANPRVFCRRLFLANSPRIRYNIPASGRGRGCPLFVFRSSASLRPRRGGAISLSHRSVITYV